MDINSYNFIRNKDALAQIKTKIIIQDFRPKVKPYNHPSNKGSKFIL
jgi:hypothetical protein